MNTMICLAILAASAWVVMAAESEVWYDASGKVVKVTAAEQPKEVYLPDWRKRELARQARMDAQRHDRTSRSGRHWAGSDHAYSYGFYDQGYEYGHGWSCRPRSYWGSRSGGYGHGRAHGHSRSMFHFDGTYRRSGWSVRVRF